MQNEAYLGLPIFRFYIKCTRCLAEITFKVDASGLLLPPRGLPTFPATAGRPPFTLSPGSGVFGELFMGSIIRKGRNTAATQVSSSKGFREHMGGR